MAFRQWVLVLALVVLVICHSADASARRKRRNVKRKKGDAQAHPEAHIPSEQAIEIHHSLHRPLDRSQVYWNFGGSTVLTKKHIRLTPAAQNRKGWLWNDYPLESENWEVQFEVDVYSKPHFGGDGFAFWLLDGSQDPTFHSANDYLNGDTFGLKNDFKGVGVCFDVYDNDGNRDNPSVFVLNNPNGEARTYNHDNDYSDDMYKNVSPGTNAAFKCIANIRNAEAPTKVMVKFLRRILHVYVDTNDGLGYKFCLAVQFDKPFSEHHIAFSAMTGQVADAHDIISVSTKYLDSSDEVNDDNAPLLDGSAQCPTTQWLTGFVTLLATAFLAGFAIYQLSTHKQLVAAEINEMKVCDELNKLLLPEYGAQAFCTALMLLRLELIGLALTLPLTAYRAYLIYVKQSYKWNPAQFGANDKYHGPKRLSVSTTIFLHVCLYVITFLFALYSWHRC